MRLLFLDTYRTLCGHPPPELRRLFDDLDKLAA